MPVPRKLLRLTPDELDELLGGARTIHVATVDAGGRPHVTPLWFVWLEGDIWVNSLIKSRRTSDLRAGSPVAVCADDGEAYAELRGAVLRGRFVEAGDSAPLDRAERAFAAKYFGGSDIPRLRSHAWFRLAPESIASWDFRKIPTGRDRRLEAQRLKDAT